MVKKFALIVLMLSAGCVKTVYLPADAAFYKIELEKCRLQKSECADLLDESLEHISDLESIP